MTRNHSKSSILNKQVFWKSNLDRLEIVGSEMFLIKKNSKKRNLRLK